VFGRLPTSWQQRLPSPNAAAFVARHQRNWPLHTYRNRDYGVAFELPLAAAEQLLHLTDERQVYLLRHYCTWLVCLAGLAAFYVVATRRFGSWQPGLLGTLLLILSPRLFLQRQGCGVYGAVADGSSYCRALHQAAWLAHGHLACLSLRASY
jgi:hypothetical protein